MKKILCWPLLCLTLSGIVLADTPSLKEYRYEAFIAPLKCKGKYLEYVIANDKDSYAALLGCADSYRSSLKINLEKATKSFKNSAAKLALKEHYLAVVT